MLNRHPLHRHCLVWRTEHDRRHAQTWRERTSSEAEIGRLSRSIAFAHTAIVETDQLSGLENTAVGSVECWACSELEYHVCCMQGNGSCRGTVVPPAARSWLNCSIRQLLEPASNMNCPELRQARMLKSMHSPQVHTQPVLQTLLYLTGQAATGSKLRAGPLGTHVDRREHKVNLASL